MRAGCGDGIIFDKDAGFTTEDLDAESPYFPAFSMRDEEEIRFECNFTLCDSVCDGSSCSVERYRRDSITDMYISDITLYASTRLFRLE